MDGRPAGMWTTTGSSIWSLGLIPTWSMDGPNIQRLTVYEEQTAPVLDYYRRQSLLHEVDGLGTPDDVFQRILKVVRTDR